MSECSDLCRCVVIERTIVLLSLLVLFFFFFKQKTAYEMRISDWSSDVCSSDLHASVELVDGEWRLDLDRLLALASERTKAIFVNSPGNPTGWKIGRASCRERVCQYV